jgi:ectoine hydroxylase-related dioxygenase (phytanoyl-CoA dioxygenase family)
MPPKVAFIYSLKGGWDFSNAAPLTNKYGRQNMASTTFSDADVSRYREDGVVCLRGTIPVEWIERLRTGIDADVANPGPMKRVTTSSGQSGSFLDFQLWQRHDACRSFVFESLAAEIVARLMGSREVVLYHDRLRVKEPGTPEGQAWHHDQPYYPIDGEQLVSLWLPLDAIPAATSIEYIRGSHRWGRWFQPRLVERGSTGAYAEDPRFEPLPDIEAERSRYEFLSWDTEPGDVIAFHGLTLHGAASKASAEYRCRTWETRWCGDDARFAARVGQ